MLPRFYKSVRNQRALRAMRSRAILTYHQRSSGAEEAPVSRLNARAMLSVAVAPVELPLLHPFKIARGDPESDRTHRPSFECAVTAAKESGEATPIERYGESVESVTEFFESHALASQDPYRSKRSFDAGIPAGCPRPVSTSRCTTASAKNSANRSSAARARSRRARRRRRSRSASPIRETDARQGRGGRATPRFSRSSSERPACASKSRRSQRSAAIYPARFASTPTKAGLPERPLRILRELRTLRHRILRTADSGGLSRAAALDSRTRRRFRSSPTKTRMDRQRSAALHGCVDGVNVKLAKSGGIRGALAMIQPPARWA